MKYLIIVAFALMVTVMAVALNPAESAEACCTNFYGSGYAYYDSFRDTWSSFGNPDQYQGYGSYGVFGDPDDYRGGSSFSTYVWQYDWMDPFNWFGY
jgi:hypothetical protein